MWWQDQLAVLKSGQPVGYLLMLALVPIADACFGFSRRLAARLNMIGQEDLILLSIVILFVLQFFDANMFMFNDAWGMVDFAREFSPRALQIFAVEFWALQIIAIACAIGCSVLARRKGRSPYVWFGLGYLGALGSMIWLLKDRRKAVV
jgi:hypothetical protein